MPHDFRKVQCPTIFQNIDFSYNLAKMCTLMIETCSNCLFAVIEDYMIFFDFLIFPDKLAILGYFDLKFLIGTRNEQIDYIYTKPF